MSRLFWDEAKLDVIWESPDFFVRKMEYAMPAPATAGPDYYEEGYGFFFYEQGIFDLMLQGRAHVIDPTCLIFNHKDDEWVVGVHPDEVVHASEIVVNERFLRQLAPHFDHQSVFQLPTPRAHTSHAIVQLNQRLQHEIAHHAPQLLIESLVATLCVDSLRQFSDFDRDERALPARHSSDSEIEIVESAKIFLQDHLSSDVSLQTLAEHVNLSPFHLLRTFKARTGQTPHQYLTHARINLAKELLLDTDAGITQIAYRIGYQNPSHFARQFRRQTGFNPREFRVKS